MPFLWDEPALVVAHRGSPREAPENTLASFRAAKAAGAPAIELDVRLTRDGEVVVLHDATLGRTVEGEGSVEEMDAQELLRRDAGAWFSPAFRGERVPRLSEVFREVPDILVNVEIKPDALNAELLPKRVLEVVQDAHALERVLVTSFDPHLAVEYAKRAGRPAGGLSAFPLEPGDLEGLEHLSLMAVAADALDEGTLSTIRAAGKHAYAWTVNDLDLAAALVRRGVHGIITDRPRETLARLA